MVRPVKGISPDSVDKIQKELLKYCKYLRPVYIPQTEPVMFDGKMLLLIWCPGGYERPYACPKSSDSKNSEKIYYIRKLSSTIEATDLDVKELMSLTHNVPFDDRINPKAEMKDLKYPIIRNYLQNVNSSLINDIDNLDVVQIAKDLRIADGPTEYYKPLNVGLLFFNDHPEAFFPYSQIEVVNIPDPTGQGMEERIFAGPIDEQLRDALSYIKNNVIAEKIFKVPGQAEAVRVKNYSYEAIEEFLANRKEGYELTEMDFFEANTIHDLELVKAIAENRIYSSKKTSNDRFTNLFNNYDEWVKDLIVRSKNSDEDLVFSSIAFFTFEWKYAIEYYYQLAKYLIDNDIETVDFYSTWLFTGTFNFESMLGITVGSDSRLVKDRIELIPIFFDKTNSHTMTEFLKRKYIEILTIQALMCNMPSSEGGKYIDWFCENTTITDLASFFRAYDVFQIWQPKSFDNKLIKKLRYVLEVSTTFNKQK